VSSATLLVIDEIDATGILGVYTAVCQVVARLITDFIGSHTGAG